MSTSSVTSKNRGVLTYLSWKIILGITTLPFLMNVISEIINLAHFNTFEGSRGEELIANILFYIGNWPTLLLSIYPYELTTKGEIVYDGSGWLTRNVIILNLVGWSLIGLIISYVIRKSKRRANSI